MFVFLSMFRVLIGADSNFQVILLKIVEIGSPARFQVLVPRFVQVQVLYKKQNENVDFSDRPIQLKITWNLTNTTCKPT